MQDGSLDPFFAPLPADWVRVPAADGVTAVSVAVNGIVADCNDVLAAPATQNSAELGQSNPA